MVAAVLGFYGIRAVEIKVAAISLERVLGRIVTLVLSTS
jgi:hypothetical protein